MVTFATSVFRPEGVQSIPTPTRTKIMRCWGRTTDEQHQLAYIVGGLFEGILIVRPTCLITSNRVSFNADYSLNKVHEIAKSKLIWNQTGWKASIQNYLSLIFAKGKV